MVVGRNGNWVPRDSFIQGHISGTLKKYEKHIVRGCLEGKTCLEIARCVVDLGWRSPWGDGGVNGSINRLAADLRAEKRVYNNARPANARVIWVGQTWTPKDQYDEITGEIGIR